MTDRAIQKRPDSTPARAGEVRTLADFVKLGQYLIQNKLVPESIDTPEKAAVIMLKGQELGMKPMSSLEHIYVVNGRAGIDTAILEKLYTQAGHKYRITEHTKDLVRGTLTLKGGEPQEHTLTMAEVVGYGWDANAKGVIKWSWKAMPKLMLGYRWLTTGIRKFAKGVELDVLTGDELEDEVPEAARGKVVNGIVREILTEEGSIAEVSPKPQEEQAESEHWALDKSNQTTLVAKMLQCTLTDKEVLLALGEDCGTTITQVREYPKSLKAAVQALENYVDRKTGESTQRSLF